MEEADDANNAELGKSLDSDATLTNMSEDLVTEVNFADDSSEYERGEFILR